MRSHPSQPPPYDTTGATLGSYDGSHPTTWQDVPSGRKTESHTESTNQYGALGFEATEEIPSEWLGAEDEGSAEGNGNESPSSDSASEPSAY
jgi:hypothetical protein